MRHMSLSSIVKKLLLTFPLVMYPMFTDSADALKDKNLRPLPRIECVTESPKTEPIEKDEESGIELRVLYGTDKGKGLYRITAIAQDTKGKKKGIKKIELYENGKRIHTSNTRFLTADIKRKKNPAKYNLAIIDSDGNMYITKPAEILSEVLKVPPMLLLAFKKDKNHLIDGYTPSFGEAGYFKNYDKNSLKFKLGETEVIIPAMKDEKAKCLKCHNPQALQNTIGQKLALYENMVLRLWDTNQKLSLRQIILNPADISKITEKDIKNIEEAMVKEGLTERQKEMYKRMFNGGGSDGVYYTDKHFIATMIGPRLESILLHEFTHALQRQTPIKLSKTGEKHLPSNMTLCEPFAYYISALTEETAPLIWIIDEIKATENRHSDQTEFVKEIVRTYCHYFDKDDFDPEAFAKAVDTMEDKTLPMMRKTFLEYNQNVLAMDTLAIEAQSHEFPLEAIIAANFNPIITDTDPKKVEEGVIKCNELWDTYRLKTEQMTLPIVREQSNSYLAGGDGIKENLMTNVKSAQYLIKESLLEAGYSKREVLQIYHTFLKQRFSDGNGNFNYEPDTQKMMVVLELRFQRAWTHYVCEKANSEDDESDAIMTPESKAKMEAWMTTSENSEVKALYAEKKRLESKLSPSPVQGNASSN